MWKYAKCRYGCSPWRDHERPGHELMFIVVNGEGATDRVPYHDDRDVGQHGGGARGICPREDSRVHHEQTAFQE
jgi:hypothetical protein